MQADRILIADDSPAIHVDFRKILTNQEREGDEIESLAASIFGDSDSETASSDGEGSQGRQSFTVDSAYQGEEALQMVVRSVEENTPYAVAFLDVRMPPGWDGVETLERIWRVDPRIQVVLCTAYTDYSWQDIAARVGESDQLLILRKPFSLIEVRQLAASLCTKWKLAREGERRVGDLESAVADRTQALAAANEELRREIAERERAERELRRAQRLEALGRIAAGIGHEINNPLTFLIGGMDAARDELASVRTYIPQNSYREVDDLLQAAAVGAERIACIVRNVKLFARPDEQGMEAVDMPATIQMALEIAMAEIGDNIDTVMDLAVVPPVRGRRIEIEQVIINLLTNAAQALRGAGSTDPKIHIALRVDNAKDVVMEIRDNGPGIPIEHLDKIFDPFFTTKPVNQGTGLGLSICHGIVTGLGGEIDIRSTVDKGTSVLVTLPAFRLDAALNPAQSSDGKPVTASTPTLGRIRILVVDDEPLVLDAIRRALPRQRVVGVTSARSALLLATHESFDLILCDIMMPDINGMKFYEELSETRPDMEPRVMFLTGGTNLPEVREFLDRVDKRCIEKPVARERLTHIIADAMASLEYAEDTTTEAPTTTSLMAQAGDDPGQ